MDSIKRLNETKKRLADVYITDTEKILELQILLAKQLKRDVSLEEAKCLGTELVAYYQALAGGRKLILGDGEIGAST